VRRYIGVAEATVLTLALSFATVAAADLAAPSSGLDIGSALMLQVFGETGDSRASFAASLGDQSSESPFRDLALQVDAVGTNRYVVTEASQYAADRLTMRDLAAGVVPGNGAARLDAIAGEVHFSPSFLPSSGGETLPPSAALLAPAYKPEPPEPNISPAPGAVAFAAPQLHGTDFTSLAQSGDEQLGVNAGTSPLVASQNGLNDGDASFDLRAGKHSLNLNVSSQYEHVADANAEGMASPSLGAAGWQAPGVGAALAVPNYSDMNLLSLGAGISVPVVHGVTLNLNYDAQRLYGAYGLPGLVNLDTIDNSYGGKLTFQIPKSSSSLSISAYQDRFQDSLLPINGSTQTREDVNFTVKF